MVDSTLDLISGISLQMPLGFGLGICRKPGWNFRQVMAGTDIGLIYMSLLDFYVKLTFEFSFGNAN